MSSAGDVLVVLASANRRGAEMQGASLAAELSQRGVRARAVALSPSSSAASVEAEVLGPSPTSLATIRALRREASRSRVVIGYGSWTLPVCTLVTRFARAPFIYRSIGDPAAWVRGRAHRARTGFLFRRATRVAALFPDSARTVNQLYGVPEHRIAVIQNARSESYFRPWTAQAKATARSDLGLAPDAPVVTFIGSFSAEKRPQLVVEAARALPGVDVLAVGDGPMRDVFEQARVDPSLVGRLRVLDPVDDVRPLIAASDVMLLTSATEGMPGVLIEAALMGVPAVATDVGAARSVVGPGGIVVDAATSGEALGSALVSALERAQELGRAAHEHATENFTWDVVIPRWLAIVDDAIAA